MEMFAFKTRSSKTLVLALWLSFAAGALAQGRYDPPYPRVAVQLFGRSEPEYYAQFDLIILPRTNPLEVQAIKALNPDAIVLSTHVWTQKIRNFRMPDFKDEWLARDSKGNILKPARGFPLINITNLCPRVNGKRYNEAMPDFLRDHVDLSVFDGIGTDWAWSAPHKVTDIDLDGNGKNDYQEYGKNWVNAKWVEGLESFIRRLRSNIGMEPLLWVNSGGFHEWGIELTNGINLDHWPGFFSWRYFLQAYDNFMSKALKPHVFLLAARPYGGDPRKPDYTRDYLSFYRFMLCGTLMGDGFFQGQPFEADENKYIYYYDEYDVDLGYPTSEPQALSNGCYVRFFDKGLALLNPTGSPQRVRDSDLARLSGYAGPYYRFMGNQDPLHNNGKRFDSIQLDGWTFPKGGKTFVMGDGIILVTEPRIVVADIFIDNLPHTTSPMTDAAKFKGAWTQTVSGDDYYASIALERKGWYAHAVIPGGDGSATATFRPRLAVPGKYEIFEWHGQYPAPQASNVPYIIDIGGNRREIIVDQTRNQGQWNSLGVYDLPQGTSTAVIITNKANGYVIADAIKFVLQTGEQPSDARAPQPPRNIRVRESN